MNVIKFYLISPQPPKNPPKAEMILFPLCKRRLHPVFSSPSDTQQRIPAHISALSPVSKWGTGSEIAGRSQVGGTWPKCHTVNPHSLSAHTQDAFYINIWHLVPDLTVSLIASMESSVCLLDQTGKLAR